MPVLVPLQPAPTTQSVSVSENVADTIGIMALLEVFLYKLGWYKRPDIKIPTTEIVTKSTRLESATYQEPHLLGSELDTQSPITVGFNFFQNNIASSEKNPTFSNTARKRKKRRN